MHQCEALYGQGRIFDAAELFLEMENSANEDVKADKLIVDWMGGESLRSDVEQ